MVGMSENVPTVPKGGNKSMSRRTCELKIMNGDEVINLPCMICTKVREVKEMLAERCMVSVDAIEFFYRAGGYMTKQNDLHEIAPKTVVRGIKSFSPQAHVWHAPIGIIGTGYHGLKTAMTYMKDGNSNIVCFDRNNIVGGYCWITAANKTSRLQTELASFHVWSGRELLSDRVSYPQGWGIWPYKAKVLEHFQWAAEQYGVKPYFRFGTNVVKLDVVGDKQAIDRKYMLSLMPEGQSDSSLMEEFHASVIYHYAGSMTRNRIIEYPGEEGFEGRVGYGMNDDTPYDHLQDCRACILGNGAFAVENARTCIEYGGKKVYLLTRRKNLASPRVPCWFVHQGIVPVPAGMLLNFFEPMYRLCGFGDPWDYFAVHGSKEKMKATIVQGSRFGIGDVTFLAVAWGRLEYIQDTLKRINKNKLTLTGGRALEDINIILKALGLLGDFTVDRFHRMKQVVGQFCDGDFRRIYEIDATGMNAANFATFSQLMGIGSIRVYKYLHEYPKEFYRVQGSLLQQLPVNKANEKEDKPCHVTDAKFAQSSAMILEGMIPNLSKLGENDSEYKQRLYHTTHPVDKFLAEAQESWDAYQKKWKSEGFDHEHIPYPYTKEVVLGMFQTYSEYLQFPVSADGPQSVSYAEDGSTKEEGSALGQPPTWVKDQGAIDQVMGMVLGQDGPHQDWWKQHSTGNASFQLIKQDEAQKSREPYVPEHGQHSVTYKQLVN
uniref:FAD/NAD(P)-binding domain-containing protein n=1 Tax=Alexandrium catenella TaxID=2925 RepID=A0A7S1LJQ3_ALECA|mmetsp:Transcript_114782/g.305156  ORF Transcript_114782/g.305156 Transcript_114782/m.305156 type:complete len:717 (+) Transcript_114782:101-2251(+)